MFILRTESKQKKTNLKLDDTKNTCIFQITNSQDQVFSPYSITWIQEMDRTLFNGWSILLVTTCRDNNGVVGGVEKNKSQLNRPSHGQKKNFAVSAKSQATGERKGFNSQLHTSFTSPPQFAEGLLQHIGVNTFLSLWNRLAWSANSGLRDKKAAHCQPAAHEVMKQVTSRCIYYTDGHDAQFHFVITTYDIKPKKHPVFTNKDKYNTQA